MRCPECYRRLRKARAHEIEIDTCPSCRGVWFDAGELEAYRRSQALASGRDAGHVTFEATAPVPGSDCPHCKTATLSEGRAGDLRLYRCTECTGCFLLKPEQDLRRVLFEAAWHYRHPPRVGVTLRQWRQGQPATILALANRAMETRS